MKDNNKHLCLYEKLSLQVSAWFILLLGFCATAAEPASNEKVILLEGPGDQPVALYTQALLEKAYVNLGYRVEYRPIPLARSFVEANAGRLDGLRARVKGAAEQYPNLIAVPYVLFDFDVVLLGDRRKCGICGFQQIKKVSTLRGFKAFEDYLITQSPRNLAITYTTGVQQMLDLLEAGRTSAVVLPNLELPTDFYRSSPHWIKHTLVSLPDYHYLHKKHAALAQDLSAELSRLEQQGTAKQLMQKFAPGVLYKQTGIADLDKISAATAYWVSYTDKPDSLYRRLLSEIYAQQLDVDIGNWRKAKQTFYSGKTDILIGAYDFELGDAFLRSDMHLFYEQPLMAFAKDKAKLESWLSGQTDFLVCYRKGFELIDFLPDNTDVYEGERPDDCHRMMAGDRIDAMIEYTEDAEQQVLDNYVSKQVFPAQPLFIGFQKSARGRQLKQHFDKGFRQLIEDGRAREFYTTDKDFLAAKLLITQDQE